MIEHSLLCNVHPQKLVPGKYCDCGADHDNIDPEILKELVKLAAAFFKADRIIWTNEATRDDEARAEDAKAELELQLIQFHYLEPTEP